MFCKKCSEKVSKFTEKSLVTDSFFNKVEGLEPATCFRELCKINRYVFLQKMSGQVVLENKSQV